MKKKQLIWIGVATCASILIAIILSFVLMCYSKYIQMAFFQQSGKLEMH